jgi:prevent-host-death family protein
MKTTNVTTLKARLSEYLRLVKRGSEVVILERGQPIARLVPARGADAMDAHRAELIRLGILRPGRGPAPARFGKVAPKLKDPEGLALKAVLEEREHGR